jgi:trans-AT polyketide synthase/acyltransferase/oxidoreductase domain-containing protein
MEMGSQLTSHGYWQSRSSAPAFGADDIVSVAQRVREPMFLVQDPRGNGIGVAVGGDSVSKGQTNGVPHWPLLALLPPLYPEWLGCRSFGEVHGVRFPYVSGAMANGIATTQLVIAMAKAGFLGFFGAAGLPLHRVEAAVHELQSALGDRHSWGCNLIHSPNEPALEESVADLYIQRGVKRVSAAAYMALTPAVVRFALSGIRQDAQGHIQRERHVFAKISRPEVARRFLEPAPDNILDNLVRRGLLTTEEARLGRLVPVAEDIIVESDSGGHTDNRPLSSLFPGMLALRDEISQAQGYDRSIRIGAAGGLGTPTAVAAAFSMGAAFALTGSINQACVESGLDADGRAMLAEASIADIIMAPAADMFEMGVEVQVLRRGTMFAVRARKLYELHKGYDSLDAIPRDEREKVETQILRATFEEAWASTKAFWMDRDPGEVAKAEENPRHKMALVFRSYLGQSSRWAIAGDTSRRTDYQIWCGPAMGAFNRWTAGTFLAAPEHRSVVQVARNLMEGAAVVTRAQQLRSYGVPMPTAGFDFRPRLLA